MGKSPRHVMSASIVAGALALGLVGATTARADTTPAQGLNYVALGDSYSAGSGVLPVDPTNLLCLRSTVNYPHVIASRTGAHLKDVTCGAAQTKDFSQSQYPGTAPQLDALATDTDLVTLTIGGNDDNTFINAILACGTAGVFSGGQGVPARTRTAPRSTTRSTRTRIPRSRPPCAPSAPRRRTPAWRCWVTPGSPRPPPTRPAS